MLRQPRALVIIAIIFSLLCAKGGALPNGKTEVLFFVIALCTFCESKDKPLVPKCGNLKYYVIPLCTFCDSKALLLRRGNLTQSY